MEADLIPETVILLNIKTQPVFSSQCSEMPMRDNYAMDLLVIIVIINIL